MNSLTLQTTGLPTTAPTHEVHGSSASDPAFDILNYNQQLVQFADAKAGNLIVINSLFIAAAQAGGLGNSLFLRGVQGSLLVAAGLALIICLGVIAGQANLPRLPRKDFIFWGDITQRRSADQYVRDYQAAPTATHSGDALRRTYVLALIARRKFNAFAWAQSFTMLAAALWLFHGAASLLLQTTR
jgi:hypothetical protein